VPAVLAAYNWAPNTDRYRKLALFVDAFFTKFPTFQNPPFPPEVERRSSLSAAVARLAASAGRRAMAQEPQRRGRVSRREIRGIPENRAREPRQNVKTDADRESLFKQFQAWGGRAKREGAGAPSRRSARRRLFRHFSGVRSRASAQRGRHRDAPA